MKKNHKIIKEERLQKLRDKDNLINKRLQERKGIVIPKPEIVEGTLKSENYLQVELLYQQQLILKKEKETKDLIKFKKISKQKGKPKTKSSKNQHNKDLRKRKTYKGKNLQKISKGEYLISQHLIKKGILFSTEKTFEDLVNPKTNQFLRYDFHIPKFNICIEFDGIQHFQYTPDFHTKDPFKGAILLEDQKYRDHIKDMYCLTNEIKLIRIPYKDINRIDSILNNSLPKG